MVQPKKCSGCGKAWDCTCNEPTVKVQMGLRKSTLDRISRLSDAFRSESRTDAICKSLDIAEIVVNALRDGKQVFIESEDEESLERIVVPGVSP